MNLRNISSICILFILSSCAYTIQSTVEKTETFTAENKLQRKTISYLAPEVDVFRIGGYAEKDYALVQNTRIEIANNIRSSAKKFKINILPESNNSSLLLMEEESELYASLKRKILQTNQIQQNIFNEINKRSAKPFVQQVFTIDPFLGYDYAPLAKALGTETIGMIGVIAIDLKTKDYNLKNKVRQEYYVADKCYIQYHYIVNVITGKIIYREVRVVDKTMKPNLLFTSIYDSFYLLNKNMNQ